MSYSQQFQRQRQQVCEYAIVFGRIVVFNTARKTIRSPYIETFSKFQFQIIGPKTITLYRNSEHGFGFTLRHFIVYPPDNCGVSEKSETYCIRCDRWKILVMNCDFSTICLHARLFIRYRRYPINCLAY